MVHLKDWIIHTVSERNWLQPPDKSMRQWSEGCNMTAPLNQPPRFPTPWLRCRRWQTWSGVWSCVRRVCARQPSAVTQCRALAFVTVAVTSQKTQGSISLSLLTSSVCLAACLIAGVCPAKGRRRAARCQAQSCCCKSKTNMHLWYQHTYSSKCCKSLKQKECRSCLGSSELKSSLCFPLTSNEMDDVSPFPPIV